MHRASAELAPHTSRTLLIRHGGDEAALLAKYEMLGGRGGRDELLGRGGFGTVRLARDRASGLVRAVKAIAVDATGPDALAEVDALMELEHPNVVRLFEYYGDRAAPAAPAAPDAPAAPAAPAAVSYTHLTLPTILLV